MTPSYKTTDRYVKSATYKLAERHILNLIGLLSGERKLYSLKLHRCEDIKFQYCKLSTTSLKFCSVVLGFVGL
jgi:hypothetical protein